MTKPATNALPSKLLALASMRCRPGAPRLNNEEIAEQLAALAGWTLDADRIVKTYSFANYYETMAFVNAIAFVAHADDHHPDLGVHYNRCVVTYHTHDAGGVTLNDCIGAAKVERLAARG